MPAAEADHIISQVAVLDTEIRERNAKRAALLQRLNTIQSTIISKLPVEVLSRVLWFATRPHDSDGQPRKPNLSDTRVLFQLGSICSHWYRTTRSSPQLWTAIGLHKKPTSLQTQNTDYVSLLRYYYQHVGPTGLSIHVSDLDPAPEAMVGEILKIVLSENPEKMKSFHTDKGWSSATGKSVWAALLKYGLEDVEFPQLKQLELEWGRDGPQVQDSFLFRRSPRLRALSLDGGGVDRIPLQFSWGQLTELSLKDIGTGYALQLLALCPNLIAFYFQHLPIYERYGWSPTSQGFTEIQSLQNLAWKVLASREPTSIWDWRPKTVDRNFLKHFRFPSLKYLDWMAPLPSDVDDSIIRDFFAQMCGLEVLTYTPSPKSKFSIKEHLHYFQNLVKLDLYFIAKLKEEPDEDDSDADESYWGTGATDEDRGVMEEWLYRLTIKPGENLFPQLRILHLTMGDVEAHGPLVVLYSRRNGPVDWSDPIKQNPEALTLLPYDPTSSHWKHCSRLTEFVFKPYHDSTEMEWECSPHYSALQDMISEAKMMEEVERSIWRGFKLLF